MRFQSYFNTAVQLIKAYDGSMPLAHYLKNYFSQHKKHGSQDRKYITHLCYCFYRLGHSLLNITIEERLKIALFLCNDNIEEWSVLFDADWINAHVILLSERIQFIQTAYPFHISEIFPWQNELSEGIDAAAFSLSHLEQPDLFLRTRPGKKNIVIQKLQQQHINFTELGENSIALPNTTKIDTLVELNKEAVVQDYSSQQIEKFFQRIKEENKNVQSPIKVWDCCAASGGKSILAYDNFENIELTVSDIRPSIIHNLQQRFKEVGIRHYKSFVADLIDARGYAASRPTPYALSLDPFDLIICDAPCTGSGTWGRTPEQLYFFNADKVSHYANLQQKITQAVIPHVSVNGYFLYITCSVFKKENEMAVELIQQRGLRLIAGEVLIGYDKKADTMFAALFKK